MSFVTDLQRRLNRSPVVAAAASSVLLLLAIAGIFWTLRPPREYVRSMYYFDLDRGALFHAEGNQLTPIAVPGDAGATEPAGVRAFVYGCGECGSEEDRFVAWLEMHNPEAVAAARARHTDLAGREGEAILVGMLDEGYGGTMLRAPEGGDWILSSASEARELRRAALARCGDQTPVRCLPD